MSTTWTDAQKQVICARGKNILVSAAAGSGKTAVLVERICSLLLDEKNPIDADRLVVVTFTKAAAGEMKERLINLLEEKEEADPENPQIRRQLQLVHQAQISTMDSFCLGLIRSYFHKVDMEPGFRICDNAQQKLLFQNAMDKVLRENYERKDPAFIELTDCFSDDRDDASLRKSIEGIFFEIQSQPYPLEYLNESLAIYDCKDEVELFKNPYMGELMVNFKGKLKAARYIFESLVQEVNDYLMGDCDVEFAEVIRGKYLPLLNGFIDKIDGLSEVEDTREFLEKLREAFSASKSSLFEGNFPPKSKKTPENFLDLHKRILDEKNDANKLIKKESVIDPSLAYQQLEHTGKFAKTTAALVEEVAEAFAEEKRNRKLVDFSDLNHFALNLLIEKDPESGERKKTDVAQELSEYYKAIMVDEYQDFNPLQEAIATAISNGENYFMVGDVKQSIYAFRNSDPRIFLDKYQKSDKWYEGSSIIRTLKRDTAIELNKNFRSRKEVLDSANEVFYKTMDESVGGVTYDKRVSLNPGAVFPGDPEDYKTEVTLLNSGKEILEKHGYVDQIDQEAVCIRDKISSMVQSGFKVKDKKTEELRPVRYGDFAVLVRRNDSAEIIANVLNGAMIPTSLPEKENLFQTVEVKRVLSFLRVLENPLYDLELATVLLSPMFGLSDDELLWVKGKSEKGYLFDKVKDLEGENATLQSFLDLYDELRPLVNQIPLHEMIHRIYRRTGYLNYVSALPAGRLRRANLLHLMETALEYEKTGTKGLFAFLRYVDRIIKYDIHTDESSEPGEAEDRVLVMTIHKSKGLEFPVVFLADISGGKKTSLNALSIGSMGLLTENRGYNPSFKQNTLMQKAWCSYKDREEMGESLRLLYVAMTRAKEKLLVIGSIKAGATKDSTAEENFEKNRGKNLCLNESIPFYEQLKLDQGLFGILYPVAVICPKQFKVEDYASGWDEGSVTYTEVFSEESENTSEAETEKTDDANPVVDSDPEYTPEEFEKARASLEKSLQFDYPYKGENQYKEKYSVSEIKHRRMDVILALEEEENARENLKELNTSDESSQIKKEFELPSPAFISGEAEDYTPMGALRGTAMHRFFECFDFTVGDIVSSVEEQIQSMRDRNMLSEEQEKMLSKQQIKTFLSSDFAKRMHEAALKDQLLKEQAFVFGDTPEVLFQNGAEEGQEHLLLVQGIIDAFFIEEDGIVLLDYKTDRVDTGERLRQLYKEQMRLYVVAIQKVYNLPVKEVYLYSFKLGQLVPVSF